MCLILGIILSNTVVSQNLNFTPNMYSNSSYNYYIEFLLMEMDVM